MWLAVATLVLWTTCDCYVLGDHMKCLKTVPAAEVDGVPQTSENDQVLAYKCMDKDLSKGPFHFQIPGICKQFSCENVRDGWITNIQFRSKGCQIEIVEPPCFLTEIDTCKPYPDCCSTIKCPEK